MRYVLAIVALAISGVLLLLGIGQRTFLAGPAEITHTLKIDSETPYAVIDAEEFSQVEGQANIVMRGDDAFAATAKTRDADAWLEPFDHVELAVDSKTNQTVPKKVKAKQPDNDILIQDDNGKITPMDPRGSDLWLESRTGEDGALRMPVAPLADQSILVAGKDGGPVPDKVSIVWVQDRATPLAGPLLVAGGVFAALGAVLYLFAFDRDRRALGPQRGRRGPLVGVQNVFGRSKRRAAQSPSGETIRRGSLSTAPALESAEAAEAADAVDAEAKAESQVETAAETEAEAEPVTETAAEPEEQLEGGQAEKDGDDDAR